MTGAWRPYPPLTRTSTDRERFVEVSHEKFGAIVQQVLARAIADVGVREQTAPASEPFLAADGHTYPAPVWLVTVVDADSARDGRRRFAPAAYAEPALADGLVYAERCLRDLGDCYVVRAPDGRVSTAHRIRGGILHLATDPANLAVRHSERFEARP